MPLLSYLSGKSTTPREAELLDQIEELEYNGRRDAVIIEALRTQIKDLKAEKKRDSKVLEKLQEKHKEYTKLKHTFQKKERAIEKTKEKVWNEGEYDLSVCYLCTLNDVLSHSITLDHLLFKTLSDIPSINTLFTTLPNFLTQVMEKKEQALEAFNILLTPLLIPY